MQLSKRQLYWVPKISITLGYLAFVILSPAEFQGLGALVMLLLFFATDFATDALFKKIGKIEVLLTLAFLSVLGLAFLEVIAESVVALLAAAFFIHVGGAVFLAAIQSIVLQQEGAKPVRVSEGLGAVIMLIIGWTIIYFLIYG
ncbi:hypothetical protein ACR0ST_03955 [Aliidiomarina sp. Khilg15.8]